MPTITNIVYRSDRQRYWVYVDGEYCTSIRERTFPAMGLEIGTQISCEEVKEREEFHWKNQYGKASWEREQVRLNRIVQIIEQIDDRIKVNIVGFGAGSVELMKEHPDEAGKPDLEVVLKADEAVAIVLIEVTGTETKRGSDYWIRPDKLEYCKNHPDQDVWIALHYQNPKEHVIFIKPDQSKEYNIIEIVIRGSTEHYVIFTDNSPELRSGKEFSSYLITKVNKRKSHDD